MFNKFKISVKDFLNKDYSHNPEDAQSIVDYIFNNNKNNKDVEIDFKGIKTVNTAFCNVIYESLKERTKVYKVQLINCNSFIMETFDRVRDNYDNKVNKNDL